MGLFNIFSKKENKADLNKGLEKTKEGVFSKLARAVAGKSKVDDEVLDNLEEVLITSDVGVDTTVRIIERIEQRVARDKYMNASELNRILREEETQVTFRPSGAPYLIAGALAVTILFPGIIAMTALSVMLVGDTFAALVGRKLGRHKINMGTKSIEGSIAFWFFSSIVLLIFCHYYRQPFSFLVSGTFGITLATFAEIYENRLHIDDNLSIPVIVGFSLIASQCL